MIDTTKLWFREKQRVTKLKLQSVEVEGKGKGGHQSPYHVLPLILYS